MVPTGCRVDVRLMVVEIQGELLSVFQTTIIDASTPAAQVY